MKRFSALFLLIVLIPLVCTAEDAEKQVRAGIENVMDGLDFDQAADIALDVPGWPEHRSLEETVRALAGGESFSADDALTAVLGAFAKEVGALFQMMLSVMLPVVLASLLIHTLTPQSDSLSTMSKSACFVLVLMPHRGSSPGRVQSQTGSCRGIRQWWR